MEYVFVQALALEGPMILENVQKAPTLIHLNMLADLAEAKIYQS